MRLIEILNRIDSKKKAQIEAICKEWRRKVQDKLLDMMKLSLGGVRIDFEVTAAYPPQFRDVVLTDREYQQFLLYQNKPSFERLVEDADTIKRILPDVNELLYEEGSNQLQSDEAHLATVRLLAKTLLRKSPEADDFIKKLQEFNSHIFGIYRGAESSGEIQLYWAVIALFSDRWNMDIEVLTLIVLSHEYAHAYTHLGVDGNDRRWGLETFQSTSEYIIEGLAEYFSERFINEVSGYRKHWIAAYIDVLQNSPPQYQDFKKWNNPSPEAIRFAMLHARRMLLTPMSYDKFKSLIEEGKQRLEH